MRASSLRCRLWGLANSRRIPTTRPAKQKCPQPASTEDAHTRHGQKGRTNIAEPKHRIHEIPIIKNAAFWFQEWKNGCEAASSKYH
jgi:hypothetical protein